MKTLIFILCMCSLAFSRFAKDVYKDPKVYYKLDAIVQCGTVLKYEDTLTHTVNAFGKILKSHDINIEHSKVALEIKHYSVPSYYNVIHSKNYIDSSYIVLKFATGDSIVVYSRHLIGYNFSGHMGRKNMTVYSSMFKGSTLAFAENWFSLDKSQMTSKWNNEFFLEFNYTFVPGSKSVDIGVNPKVYIQDSSARLSFSNCAVIKDNGEPNVKITDEGRSERIINLFGGLTEKQKFYAVYKDVKASESNLDVKISATTNLNYVWESYNTNTIKNPNLNCVFSFIPGINCTYEQWIR